MDDQLTEQNHAEQREAAKKIWGFWQERKIFLLPSEATSQADGGALDGQDYEKSLRETLLADYTTLLEDRQKLLHQNFQLQRQLHAHLVEKKGTEGSKPFRPADAAASAQEAETRYLQFLGKLQDERELLTQLQEGHQRHLDEAKQRLEQHYQKSQEFEGKFLEFQKLYLAPEGPKAAQHMAEMEAEEKKRSTEVSAVRIQYIRTRNKLKKLTSQLKEKERLTDGLHLIDFEQLKIENTTMNEKIEERNEDLLKLRKKATTTIHILTHVKEKLQFCVGENNELKKHLSSVEEDLAKHRDALTRLKRERDSMQGENVKMRERMPLVGAHDLLLDFESRKQTISTLREDVLRLKNRHHEIVSFVESHQSSFESVTAINAAAQAKAGIKASQFRR